jgi:hypothetical protein
LHTIKKVGLEYIMEASHSWEIFDLCYEIPACAGMTEFLFEGSMANPHAMTTIIYAGLTF